MAKNQPKAPAAPRARKSKTPAQLAQAADHAAAAHRRLLRLQARQRLANQLRERHHELGGTDDMVISTYVEFIEKEIQDAYVALAFRCPFISVKRLWGFLAGRNPTFELVERFFIKTGLPFNPQTMPKKMAA